MKKKHDLWKTLKTWWPVTIAVIAGLGWLVTNSSRLEAVWNAPKKQYETEESVQQLASNLNTYTAANEAANKQRDQQLQLLSSWAMEQKK